MEGWWWWGSITLERVTKIQGCSLGEYVCVWWWTAVGYALDDAIMTSSMRRFSPILLEVFFFSYSRIICLLKSYIFVLILSLGAGEIILLARKKQSSWPPTFPCPTGFTTMGLGEVKGILTSSWSKLVARLWWPSKDEQISGPLFQLILTYGLILSSRMMGWVVRKSKILSLFIYF